jgi:hypothetical protein
MAHLPGVRKAALRVAVLLLAADRKQFIDPLAGSIGFG